MGSTMDSKEFDLYKDIRCRTNGEIYIGVVKSVRSMNCRNQAKERLL